MRVPKQQIRRLQREILRILAAEILASMFGGNGLTQLPIPEEHPDEINIH